MPRFRTPIPVDDYVIDVLMPDLVGHDHHPGAFLVYLYLYREAERSSWRAVSASLRSIADRTGLSKSTVQIALARLNRRQLIRSKRSHPTATPNHKVLRHWRERRQS